MSSLVPLKLIPMHRGTCRISAVDRSRRFLIFGVPRNDSWAHHYDLHTLDLLCNRR